MQTFLNPIPNDTEGTTFSEVLLRSYQQAPEQVCIYLLQSQQSPQQITYRSLFEGAASYAHSLKRAGVKRGEVVVIILNHGDNLIYAFFGAVLAGAVPSIMPFLTEKLSPDQYRASLSALFEITQPAAAITYAAFVEEVQRARQDGFSPREILISDNIPTDTRPDIELLEGFQARPADVVLLQHSSGTTGLQKGVALSHNAVFNQLNNYSQALRLTPEDVIISWLPLYHDMGLIAGFLLPILARIPLVLISPFDWVRAPHSLFHAITEYAGTLCWMPNFAYNFCAQKIRDRDLHGVDLSSLRALINCSEPMYWSSHQMFLERFSTYGFRAQALATCYAMAENVFAVTQGGIDSPASIETIDRQILLMQQQAIAVPSGNNSIIMVSAGQPITNTRLRVLDANEVDLPERRIGELAIHSDCMLTGYFNRPDLTAEAFSAGWYKTGDLGYLAGGELYITGRKKDLIIVGGKNIYPQDLERIAGEVDGIHPGRVVAFGVFNERAGTEDVVILVETDVEDISNQNHIADEIRRVVTRGTDIALRYVKVVNRGWLLKTSSGKIARPANKGKFLDEFSHDVTSW